MSLLQDIEGCHQLIKELLATVEHLMLRVKKLESQINQNSSNSSRPPFSDIYRKGPAFPRSEGGKVGGKKDMTAAYSKWWINPIILLNKSNQAERDIQPTKQK